MNFLSKILFPATVMAVAVSGAVGFNHEPVEPMLVPEAVFSQDTVVYPNDGYRQRRNSSQLMEMSVSDSLLRAALAEQHSEEEDTLPRLSARDTIKIPDSLRFTDPFRYKYYIALVDSLTRIQTRDSLRSSYAGKMSRGDTLAAVPDSLDWVRIDSIYVADSTLAARLRFEEWYNSLSKEARKQYDREQMMTRKMAIADSLRDVKEKEKAIKDSIAENVPRILETFALPDSMQYKRIITWTVDRDFQKFKTAVPDTDYNYHFYDYPFLRKDVNATWLGVAGSPVQYYDYFNRTSETDVEFYKAGESWTFTPGTLPHYNTKTPYTELQYSGTLLAKNKKESDNLHLFTTQNITPAFNLGLLVDRYGGGGILENEKTINKTFAFKTNYLGKKYLMHGGYIYNRADMGENGGMTDKKFIRDTVVDGRDIPVYLPDASSVLKKHTFFLDQQLRIPFDFGKRIRAKRDSTFTFNADSLDKDISTAFIGHSSELSLYSRKYEDNLSPGPGSEFYRDVMNYDKASADSMRVMYLDNKFFIKLQPWSSSSIVSKLNVGIGDYLRKYYRQNELSPTMEGSSIAENSVYAYAGAEGQLRNFFNWDAKARTVFLGADIGDFEIGANAGFNIYPFRRAKKSPISINAHFETSLKNPTYYQKHVVANHFMWDKDFSKTSTTKIQGSIDIPHWKLNAKVGYALLGNNVYYGNDGIAMQNQTAMSVFSAYLRKDLVLGPVHLDNKVLFQASSNSEVVPVPALSFNLRYYIQFVVQKDESRTNNILVMQFGVNGFYNTEWNAPAWNPNLGVFYNQTTETYHNGPYFDVFLNAQWKRACIFIKYQNATAGLKWPVKRQDYFSADRHIVTQAGLDGLKLGIYWPFYLQPKKANAGPGTSRTPASAPKNLSR